MEQIARWWDGAELWLAGLPFVPQVALVLLVALPVCGALAWLLDRALATVLILLRRDATNTEEH
ncbi:hypothetical protein G4H71_01670 [Rhodococcus triatomae]|uniref:Uncharacterized protein n=1 Tax=Rhodococcus triatomae TaxID=300028 RepID=A0A1G8DMG0_9NOCA|nr:hypothetical protein [Rhodococcus triatomae]QNG18398.1 hypothetical protein G4H72_06380 [Rhodococcus triatomae]QNG21932.1 hypothetical protein G4H71_01670 [Rhodococcus triatomae]SDH58679.1 hypothetical protein SAMN05444695_102341 [Rhodococcus triatomae]